ncbi:hypothetical protein ACTI_84050 [Actinoplanes sp. OR16]|uniref:helicase-associated domain-containing protein n=1 Tax=Actinoplanes sp. OR16 TaxID=946334 RepID=UPI000F6CA9B0|nr:helicase-associated domain-containing protein [Actinoplanes sp. OR16]BBH71720.1 hypothetical protein ACTI_84050 [Actinoplanes sp. OR16]
MSATDRLAEYLRGLSRSASAELLATRVVTEPAPATTEELAELLLRPESIVAGLEGCTLPELQLAEVVAALGDGWSRDRLAGLLCVPAEDPDVAEVLSSLSAKGLVWPGGGAHLRVMWPHPFGLGGRAEDLLAQLSVTQVRMIAERIGAPLTGRSKQSLISDVAEWLAVPQNVRGLVVRAPADVRDSLCESAETVIAPSSWRRIPAPRWAAERGLVIPSGWNGGQMPAEVALALRHIPFSPRPPSAAGAGLGADAVEREASAAATDVLTLMRAAFDVFGRTPVAVLANGGIGVKELRRVAKAIGRGEDAARFALEVAAAGGLVSSSPDGLTLSADFDSFAALEPAAQLVSLVSTWISMPACPLADGAAVLDWDRRSATVLPVMRPAVLRLGPCSLPDAALLVAWHAPVAADRAEEDRERFVAGIWEEAHLLGLMAHGSVSELGRLLAGGDRAALHEKAMAMVPPASSRVVLQNDLTAVVTGTPTAPLLALLDSLADPESRGGAWTWRFSRSSVRRAFDEGADADSLTARLAEVADQVPQGLEYLIKDVGRQHGRVQVRSVGCVLCSSDPILLDEIVASRALAGLALVRLAPTVVASAKPPAETLAALRASGYAPSSVRGEAPAVTVSRQAPPPIHPELLGSADR